ncbi:MAG: hypothetical protein ACK4VW_02865 [Anaerolineales bacterium]
MARIAYRLIQVLPGYSHPKSLHCYTLRALATRALLMFQAQLAEEG